MLPRLRRCLAVLALASGPLLALAHDGPLDPRFGDGGMRSYGFQSYNGSGRGDKASVACPGPNGTLVVTGEASDARRIVTMRLLPDGSYDSSYGAAGRATIDLAQTQEQYSPGLCLPGGKILLARRLRLDTAVDSNIRLLRIDAATGQLDPSFGQNGLAELDLDLWQSGLTFSEIPLALVALDRGEVLLLGYAAAENSTRAFAARIGANGSVAIARVYVDEPRRATARTLSTAALASDGTLWGIVEGVQPDSTRVTPFRVRLDRDTLAWIDVPDPLPADNEPDIYAGNGVLVRPDVLLVPAMKVVAGTNPPQHEPAVMIYRANGKVYLPLPPPGLPGATLTIGNEFVQQSATVLPGNRVLVGATARRVGENTAAAMHFGLVQIGPVLGTDRLDTAFGQGGVQSGAFRPVGASCGSALVDQWLSGMATWGGLPVFVGTADASCNNDGGGRDYLVGRLWIDRIFADGLQ